MLLQSYHSAWYSNMQLCKMISGLFHFSIIRFSTIVYAFSCYHVAIQDCASVIIDSALLFEVDSRWLTRVVC